MATVDREVPAQPRPGGVAGATGAARPVVRPPKPFFLRSWFALVVFVALVAAHVWGWEVAKIQPGLLVEKAPDIQRFFGEMLRPDVITFDRKQVQLTLPIPGSLTPVENAGQAEVAETLVPSLISESAEVGPETESYSVRLTASPATVAPGQTIEVSGTGFRPNTPGNIIWQSAGQSASTQVLGSFVADAQGNFTAQVPLPADEDRVINASGFPNTLAVNQEWGIGGPKLSPTVGVVVERVIETIFLALMGTTFAVFLSIPLSFLASRNLMAHNVIGTGIYVLTRTILNILRSIEVLILVVIFAATIGLGPFAGVLALTLHSIASLGKLYSEAIESIDAGPIEAITATGANRLQVIMFAVVPQFIPQFISFTLYRWDINVRMSTVLGFVGGGGIGFILQQFIQLLQWNQAATAIWAIAIVVIAMDYASAKIRAAVI